MRRSGELSLAAKQLLAFGLVVALLTAACGWAAWQLRQESSSYDRLLAGEADGARLSQEMRATMLLQVQALKNTWLRGDDPASFQRYTDEFDARARDLREQRQRMDRLGPSLTSDERALLQRFDVGWAGYLEAWPRAKAAYGGPGGGNQKAADAVMQGKDRDAVAALDGLAASLDKRRIALSSELTEDARRGSMVVVGLLAIAAVAGIVVALVWSRRVSRAATEVATAARALARGDLTASVELRSGDEIGQMADAMREMIAYLRSVALTAEAFAAGQIDGSIAPRGANDVLGLALARLLETLRRLVAETAGLVDAAQRGDLAVRGDADAYAGSYRELVAGFNATLDAIVAPIREAAVVLEKVAQRDLTARVAGGYAGQFATIEQSLNAAVAQLERSLKQVVDGSVQVASAAGQIAGSSQSLAGAASEQAAAVQEIGASLTQMTALTQRTAAVAREGEGVAVAARAAAATGLDRMGRLSGAVDRIKASANETAKIVKTIDEIAFQTNLLALNAAVEAARAGEAGKGFAVVAEEVRSLAMRSADAARTTANLIEESVRNAESGVALNAEVLVGFGDIGRQVDRVAELMSEVRAGADQQRQAIGQLDSAVTQIGQVTQQTAAGAEESAAAAEELSSQADEMQATVGQFTLSSTRASANPRPLAHANGKRVTEPTGSRR